LLPASDTLANALYWFFCCFAVGSRITGCSRLCYQLMNLLNQILAAIPEITRAVLIGFVVAAGSRVVQRIVHQICWLPGMGGLGMDFGISHLFPGRDSLFR
jgi:hypothetical protein